MPNEIFANQLHIICAEVISFTKRNFKRAIKRYGYKSVMVSKIQMYKYNCITKEQFDMEYDITYNQSGNKEERDDLSVGEDLETLFEKIKNGEVTSETIPDGDRKESLLIPLLGEEEKQKLDKKDETFLESFRLRDANMKEEFKKSEYNLKYSMSRAYRATFFV